MADCSGLSTSRASGFFAPARYQPSAFWSQPAALRAFFASAVENATGGSAAGSNSGELGGIGPGADTASEAKTALMMPGRSIASSSAVRTFGSRNSGWFGRRLSRTVVSVEPG